MISQSSGIADAGTLFLRDGHQQEEACGLGAAPLDAAAVKSQRAWLLHDPLAGIQ
jgi:hypothetical protein